MGRQIRLFDGGHDDHVSNTPPPPPPRPPAPPGFPTTYDWAKGPITVGDIVYTPDWYQPSGEGDTNPGGLTGISASLRGSTDPGVKYVRYDPSGAVVGEGTYGQNRSRGFFGDFFSGLGELLTETPILQMASIIPSPLQPFAAAANAAINKDPLSGIAALAGAGGFTNVANAAKVASAIDRGDLLGAVTPGLSLAGVSDIGGFSTKDISNAARVASAIDRGDLLGAVSPALSLADITDIGGLAPKDINTAINVVRAIDADNPLGALGAIVSNATSGTKFPGTIGNEVTPGFFDKGNEGFYDPATGQYGADTSVSPLVIEQAYQDPSRGLDVLQGDTDLDALLEGLKPTDQPLPPGGEDIDALLAEVLAGGTTTGTTSTDTTTSNTAVDNLDTTAQDEQKTIDDFVRDVLGGSTVTGGDTLDTLTGGTTTGSLYNPSDDVIEDIENLLTRYEDQGYKADTGAPVDQTIEIVGERERPDFDTLTGGSTITGGGSTSTEPDQIIEVIGKRPVVKDEPPPPPPPPPPTPAPAPAPAPSPAPAPAAQSRPFDLAALLALLQQGGQQPQMTKFDPVIAQVDPYDLNQMFSLGQQDTSVQDLMDIIGASRRS